MKRIVTVLIVRAVIATSLCLSIVVYLPSRLSVAWANPSTPAELRSESQCRSEASRYDAAIRALTAVATMKLDTAADLKKALEILNRERPNLRFFASKLAVLALNDSTFADAVKKKVPDKKAAEAFVKELEANRQAIFKLGGAESLKTRMRRAAESDAATLRRVSESLKAAVAKVKRASQASNSIGEEDLLIVSSRKTELRTSHHMSVPTFQTGFEVVAVFAVIAAAVYLAVLYVAVSISIFENLFTEEGRDGVAECQRTADERLDNCVAASRQEVFPLNITSEAECWVQWAAAKALCLLL